MKYTITCLRGTHSMGDFTISNGQSLEVAEDIYNYFNINFGTSGNFTFSAIDGPKKKAPRKKKTEYAEDVEDTSNKVD